MKQKQKNIKVLDRVTVGTIEPARIPSSPKSTSPRKTWVSKRLDEGSIELVVLGMLAALIVLLAIPLFSGVDQEVEKRPSHSQQEKVQKI